MSSMEARMGCMEKELERLRKERHIESERNIELEKRIRTLEQERPQPDATARECPCGLNRGDVDYMIEQIRDIKEKQDNLTKLQSLLNVFILDAQKHIQENIEAEKEKASEVARIQESFQEHQDLVGEHMTLHSQEQCFALAALETCAGIEDGQLQRIIKEFSLNDVFIKNKHDKRKKDFDQYNITPHRAMQEFNQRTTRELDFPIETKFFNVRWKRPGGVNEFHIVAINTEEVMILDDCTKMKLSSWPMNKLTDCRSYEWKCHIDFNGEVVELTTKIAQEIGAHIEHVRCHQCLGTLLNDPQVVA